MDVDLRIPMTNDQKALVVKAAEAEQLDVAAWVRPILLNAAKARLNGGSHRRRR